MKSSDNSYKLFTMMYIDLINLEFAQTPNLEVV